MRTISIVVIALAAMLTGGGMGRAASPQPHHTTPPVNKRAASDPHNGKQITALKSAASICMQHQTVTTATSTTATAASTTAKTSTATAATTATKASAAPKAGASARTRTVTYQSGFNGINGAPNCTKIVALLTALRTQNTTAASAHISTGDQSKLNNLIAPYAKSLQ